MTGTAAQVAGLVAMVTGMLLLGRAALLTFADTPRTPTSARGPGLLLAAGLVLLIGGALVTG